MITITFNNQTLHLEKLLTLHDLLQKKGYHQPYFAITLNQHLIPRAHYANTFLNEGDQIELITPMQGG